jgi:hypothetical protein
MRFPPFQERLLNVVSPVCGRYALALAGGYAMRAHGFTDGTVRVLSVEDAIGLKMRALHERSYAGDIIDVESVSHLYSFRALESPAKPHNDHFLPYELAMRLEFVDLMGSEEFEAYGLDEVQIRQVRRFAQAWLEDIKLRRADDGDADYDYPDVPEID